MKKTSILTHVLLCFALTAMGGNVPRDLAERVAIRFYTERVVLPAGDAMNNPSGIRSAYTETEGDIVLYYVFHMNPDGFVIVAGQQAMNPVLAYSPKGTFDIELRGCNTRWWMDSYKQQARFANENNLLPTVSHREAWVTLSRSEEYQLVADRDWNQVPPLLTTLWNQGWPYNYYCPETATGGSGGHAWAGCVATAFAQVLYYYRWPGHGLGKRCYLPLLHPEYGLQCADFGNTRYRFEEMADAPGIVNTAVAEFSYHLGVGFMMDYDPNGTAPLAIDSMDYFFKILPYDVLYREDYTDSAWLQMMKQDLDKGMPVYYGGNPASGDGHAFVCDGYQDSAYFHFNLGWGGQSNGYYYLGELVGFNYDQYIVRPGFPDTVNYAWPQNPAGSDTLVSMEGSISDGSSPIHDYDNNLSLSWLIHPQTESDSVMSVRLEFSRFKTLDQNDRLTIYDGQDMTAPVLAEFWGDTLPAVITSSGNKVFLKFSTNGSGTAPGFLVSYYANQPDLCKSTTTITDSSATITDGSGEFHYRNSKMCKWRIQPDGCDSALTLHFSYFDTEPGKDALEIYDLGSGELLASLSGHYSTPPAPLIVPGGKAMLIFRSDAIITGEGWELYYGKAAGTGKTTVISKFMVAPNPASDRARVEFMVRETEQVNISMLDVFGLVVNAQRHQISQPGIQSVEIPIQSLPSGIYLVRIEAQGVVAVRKMVKL